MDEQRGKRQMDHSGEHHQRTVPDQTFRPREIFRRQQTWQILRIVRNIQSDRKMIRLR